MIGPLDIQRWAESLYDDFLRSLLAGTDFFSPPPRRDRLGRVPAADDPTAFRDAVSPLWNGSRAVRGFGYLVVLAEHRRRNRGLQNEPVAVELPTRDDYLQLLGKEQEVAAFESDARFVLARLPQTQPALLQRPRLLIDHHGAWPGIVEVVEYLRAHPRPGCFVRALPVSVPTKFIEAHTTAIEALLALVPESAYVADAPTFEDRCGFRADEGSIRGRFLCPQLRAACGFPAGADDIRLTVGTWAALRLPAGTTVVACENRANFLALPPLPATLALWGQGGAATGQFPRLPWLAHTRTLYWGDIDPSGFAILARLRRALPSIASILMDGDTVAHHRSLLAPAKAASGTYDEALLTAPEAEAARAVSSPPRGIEQEKLLFAEGLVALTAHLSLPA